MNCNICKSNSLVTFFKMSDTEIWTNSDDNRNFKDLKLPCELNYCNNCGHIFQPISKQLSNSLDLIYKSEQHALSTLPGVGNWGNQIGNSTLFYLNKLDLSKITSALEIGCGNDYYLQFLKSNNISVLYGIEPSLKSDNFNDGIYFLKNYADRNLKINKKFDLIYAMNVFEHVYDLDGIFHFIKEHISELGNIFFCVPNCSSQIESGDTALFIHEHYNYFTESSIKNLLLKYNFTITNILTTLDTYFVYAKNIQPNTSNLVEKFPKYDYQTKMIANISNLVSSCKSRKIAFHGVCNSLNNILNWINYDFDYILLDNDITKNGKYYFNHIVNIPNNVDLSQIDIVVILPRAFNIEIEKQYRDLNFQGVIYKF